jgi:hypothetical protein
LTIPSRRRRLSLSSPMCSIVCLTPSVSKIHEGSHSLQLVCLIVIDGLYLKAERNDHRGNNYIQHRHHRRYFIG